MPTLLGRRYMRGAPPARERVIGVICLVIVAGIVVAFVRHMRQPRQPFFAVDLSRQPAAVPPEIKHARSLLPPSPAPGWVRVEPVEALAPENVERELPGEAEQFVRAGLRRLYQGRYQNRADPRQQLTVRIFDMGGPDAARSVFEATRPRDAFGEPVGLRGWRSDAGPIGFMSGRYFTQVTAVNLPGDAALTPRLLAREVADRQIAYDVEDVSAAQAASRIAGSTGVARVENLLPTPTGGEWTSAQSVSTYNPGNLWEKINGRAEQYLQFDFEKLVFGTYRLAASAAAAVDCYIYTMADPLKAFGIYQLERTGQPEPANIGKEGYRTASGLFFIKGKAYVQLLPAEDAIVTVAQLDALAQTIAASIADEGGGNWAEAVFPKEDQVAGSFGYTPKNAFNLEFLSDVFSADYEKGDARWTLFAHRAADASAAKSVFEQYARYVPRQGKVIESATDESPRFVADFGGEYDIVFLKGRFVGGATAASDLDAARSRVSALFDALND